MSILRQAYCTLIVCFLVFNLGLMFAWPSSTQKLFSSTNTTLNRPMTETELALFGSLSSMAAMIGTPLAGFMIDIVGRKYCCILFGLPQPIAWALISTIPRVEVILASVFLSGFGGCMFMIVPNFISEFCQEKIRGTMTSGSIIFFGIGLMVSYILGGRLSYDGMNYVCLSLSVLFIVLLLLVKESPTYLMKKGFDKEAAKSIAFYRSTTVNSKIVKNEMDVIRRALNPKMDDTIPEEENLNTESQTPKKLSLMQFLKKSRSTRQALLVILVMFIVAIYQGLVVFQVYSKMIFEQALPGMKAEICSITFALTNTISGFVAAYLLDYCGRRPVAIYSSIATSIVCMVLGTQIQLHWGPNWLTACFFFVYAITCTMGAGTVPYVIIAELFLPEVKAIMTMLVVEWVCVCNFTILLIFLPLNSAIGLGPVFYIFSMFGLISSIFCYHYMPETNGLTVDVIQTLIVKEKKSLKT